MVKWLIDKDIYYEMISDGSESDLYEKYQKKYTVKRLAPKVGQPDAGDARRGRGGPAARPCSPPTIPTPRRTAGSTT